VKDQESNANKFSEKIKELPFVLRVAIVVMLGIPIMAIFTVFIVIQLTILIVTHYVRTKEEVNSYRWKVSEEYPLYRASLTSWLYHSSATGDNEIEINDWLKMVQNTSMEEFESYIRDHSSKTKDNNAKRVINGYFWRRDQFLKKPASRFCLVY
jgi:hypothetical protein